MYIIIKVKKKECLCQFVAGPLKAFINPPKKQTQFTTIAFPCATVTDNLFIMVIGPSGVRFGL